MGKKKGGKKGGGGEKGGGDAAFAKTKAGKKEKEAKKLAAKEGILKGEAIYEEALASSSQEKLEEAKAEFQTILDSFEGVHTDALYFLGLCAQASADLHPGGADAAAQSDALQEAAKLHAASIAADTSNRAASAGLAHAALAAVTLDPRTNQSDPGPAEHEAAIRHLVRAGEMNAASTADPLIQLRLGDSHAALMTHSIEADAESSSNGKEIRARLNQACLAYGVAPGQFASEFATATADGDDASFLLQKLKVIHAFASWVLELEDFPEATITAAEFLSLVGEAKECSKALEGLIHMPGANGSGGDGSADSGGAAAAGQTGQVADMDDAVDRLIVGADICQFEAQLLENEPEALAGATAARADGIRLLQLATTLQEPPSVEALSSLGELQFEQGKALLDSDEDAGKEALAASIVSYTKVLALQPPKSDAVSLYNLACIHVLLGADDGVCSKAVKDALAATASKEEETELKADFKDDDDLASVAAKPWFVEFVSDKYSARKTVNLIRALR